MNNRRRVIKETEHDLVLRVKHSDMTLSIQKHKVIERKLRVQPKMLIDRGHIYYDYTDILFYAWETGQEAYVRKGVTTG